MSAIAPRQFQTLIEHISLTGKFAASRLKRNHSPNVRLFIETPNYWVKTATSSAEIAQALKLRHEVFISEKQGRSLPFSLELDRHDFECDHLLIIDRATNKIVGTYRLICSLFSRKFYSESEFNLGSFQNEPGVKLELGRLCIYPEHRNGVVMQLLWRGVTAYMKIVGARFLLGCSSVSVVAPEEIQNVVTQLECLNAFDELYDIHPIGKYVPPAFDPAPNLDGTLDIELPPLLHSYLKAGAKFSRTPALDLDFGCIDFLTIVDREKLNPLFQRRYFS